MADSTIASLKKLIIVANPAWFNGRGEEGVLPLLTVLRRQTALEELFIGMNGLDDSQQQSIREAVLSASPQCDI